MTMINEAYIVSAVRTPIGRFGGALKDLAPTDLGAHAMSAALDRAGVDGEDLDIYIFGNLLRGGHGQLLPRQAAFKAGLPKEVDGYALDMVCASGLMAVNNAANLIKLGDADVVLAGGMESMSQAGFYLSHRARWGYKFMMGNPEGLTDLLLYDGLTDPMSGEMMGDQTERLAEDCDVGRAEMDEIAYMSQSRAAKAMQEGWFSKEIAPIEVQTRKGPVTVEVDEGIRHDTTPESLANLKPAFKPDGVFTAGNSSQISDGAAALVLASAKAVEEKNLTPVAKVLGTTWAAGEPWRFPEAPIPAVNKLLTKLDMKLTDFDLFENNEAYAINNILFAKMLGVPYEQLNVFGGAIALGHPLGASGARILTTLLNAMTHQDAKRGLAAICHGMGGGAALAIERV